MAQIFVNSQITTPAFSERLNIPTIKDQAAVEQIFIKATRNQTLAVGLIYFLSRAFRDLAGETEDMTGLIKWASELARSTLQTGVDVIPAL